LVELAIVGAEVESGSYDTQRRVALEAGEPQLAVVGFDDPERAGQPAGPPRLGVVLESHEVALDSVRTEHLRRDVCRQLGGPDGALECGKLGEDVASGPVDRVQPRGLRQLVDAVVGRGHRGGGPIQVRSRCTQEAEVDTAVGPAQLRRVKALAGTDDLR